MYRSEIFKKIDVERDYQDRKWGSTFDDKNTINDWGTYINVYLAKATSMENRHDLEKQAQALLKVAALAIAALEALGRNGRFAARHYD